MATELNTKVTQAVRISTYKIILGYNENGGEQLMPVKEPPKTLAQKLRQWLKKSN